MRSAVETLLQPGEEVRAWVFGTVFPRVWLLLLSESVALLLLKRYFVVVTDRRLLLLQLRRWSTDVHKVEWDEPASGIRVERARVRLNVDLKLSRVAGGKPIRLRVSRVFRGQADELVEALGGVRT